MDMPTVYPLPLYCVYPRLDVRKGHSLGRDRVQPHGGQVGIYSSVIIGCTLDIDYHCFRLSFQDEFRL